MKKIEQNIILSKNGFNAFLLNELIDIIASQKTIFDAIAEIKAKTEGKSTEAMLQELNAQKLLYFSEISEKVIDEYGAIPDDKNMAN